ncbi:MAG: hypothetical protein RR502_06510 [Oscillospiraceae bacterium]
MKKFSTICLIALGVLTCVLSIQCLLFIQAQKADENQFAGTFCARFSGFSNRLRCCEDIENISAAEMNIRYDEIADAITYFTSSRPRSVGFLRSSTLFAPNFDASSLDALRQRIGSLALTLSKGNDLDRADIEWLQLLSRELERLQSAMYSNQGALHADVLKAANFSSIFEDFFSRIA